MLTTEGRGGAPEKMLLELSEGGQWLFRGDGDALLQEQERQKTIGSLNDRQASALEHVEETWEQSKGRIGLSAISLASLMDLRGIDTSRTARRLLEQLMERGLVKKKVVNLGMGGGLATHYVPITADTPDIADTPDNKREEASVLAEPGNYVELINGCPAPQQGWRVVAASGVVIRIEHEGNGEIREVENSEILSCCLF